MMIEELGLGIAELTADVAPLNSLLRLELKAVETYRRAVLIIPRPAVRLLLQSNAENHQRRAELLRREIEVRGGMPVDTQSPWTFFEALGTCESYEEERRALEALAQGEDLGLSDYLEVIGRAEGSLSAFLRAQLLPEQERTYTSLARLARRLH